LEKLVIEIIEHQDGLRKEFMHKQAGTLKVGETLLRIMLLDQARFSFPEKVAFQLEKEEFLNSLIAKKSTASCQNLHNCDATNWESIRKLR